MFYCLALGRPTTSGRAQRALSSSGPLHMGLGWCMQMCQRQANVDKLFWS